MGSGKLSRISLSLLLSPGLVFGTIDCQFPDAIDYRYTTVESLGLEELGLDKKIKKLVKPVQELNKNSGVKNMAVTTVKFIRDLNQMFGTKHTIDDGLYQSAVILQKNGVRVDQNKFASIQRLLKSAEKSLSVGYDVELMELKKEFGNVDDMCDEEIWGYVSIICGALLMIIPTPITIGLGQSLVTGGLGFVVMYAGKEKENKYR